MSECGGRRSRSRTLRAQGVGFVGIPVVVLPVFVLVFVLVVVFVGENVDEVMVDEGEEVGCDGWDGQDEGKGWDG